MLIVHRLSQGGHRYYLAAARDEAPGTWVGTERVVTGRDLRNALPAGAHRVPGFDLTWAAPKSVSVLHGLGPPDVVATVEAAHDAAMRAGLGYLERHACAVRIQGELVGADGFTTAAFLHRVSRAADPHLHTHAVVANAARAGDHVGALHSPLLYGERRAAGAIYHGVLRHELSAALGVTWTQPDRGRADIEQVPQQVRAAFSQRRAAIVAAGGPTRWAERVTRPERPTAEYAALQAQWYDRARAIGWQVPALGPRQVFFSGERGSLPTTDRWTRADLIVTAVDGARDGAPAADLERAVDATMAVRGVVLLGRSGNPHQALARYTTEEALERRAGVEAALASTSALNADPVALDQLRRDLAAQGRRLVVVAPDQPAADAIAGRAGVVAFAASADVPLARSDVVAVVGHQRIESRLLAPLLSRAGEVHVAMPQPLDVSFAAGPIAAGPIATVPDRAGDLTAAASASVAASAALSDWVGARKAGIDAVLVVPGVELDRMTRAAREALIDAGLRAPPSDSWAVGDGVRFMAPRPSVSVARHDRGTVVDAGARLGVQLEDGRVIAVARGAAMASSDVVPALPGAIAGREAFVLGGARLSRGSGVVHRYVTVDAPVVGAVAGLDAWRHVRLAHIDQASRSTDVGPALRNVGDLRRVALSLVDKKDLDIMKQHELSYRHAPRHHDLTR